MDVNLFLGATTLAATGFGIWGIVFHKRNGNSHPPAGEPVASQLDKLVEVLAPLATLPNRMEETLQRLAEAQPNNELDTLEHLEYIEEQLHEPLPPSWPPELVPLVERLVARLEEPVVSPTWPPGFAVSLERIADRLEAPPPESAELEKLVKHLKDLVEDIGRRRAKADEEFLPGEGTKQPPPPASLQPQPLDTPPDTRSFRPAPRAPGPINLDVFNTVTVLQDQVYELIPPESDIFRANLANLGPGWLYVRANAEPAVGDPHSIMMPPGMMDSDIPVPGHLYVMASADGTILVRLTA